MLEGRRNKIVLIGIWALFALSIVHPVFAQVPSCRVTHFDITNGIPQNSIAGLAFDEDEFLWVGTHDGLVKFNGQSFERIAESQLSSCIKMLFNSYEGEVIMRDDKKSILIANTSGYKFNSFIVIGPDSVNASIGRSLLEEKFNAISNDSVAIERLGYTRAVF